MEVLKIQLSSRWPTGTVNETVGRKNTFQILYGAPQRTTTLFNNRMKKMIGAMRDDVRAVELMSLNTSELKGRWI